ncbi:unnamed protein product [Coffea canephora]|uniref:Glucan endo-1,3-beta-D-glucosidase n=1 Tax=Coffea canephora TaxID=49390 RepID=A0A068UNL6_COFCA|nr:unnamed protein product [Coffea canephora]
MASEYSFCKTRVQFYTSNLNANVQPFLPATRITSITVGNEVLTFNDTSLSSNLLPTMQSVYSVLCSLNLQDKVSTFYTPSAGRFHPDLAPCLTAILNFHLKTGSPFLINAYPYFAYKTNPKQVPLEFVLHQSPSKIV